MNIGIVAIGRNEGARLIACLKSALRDCPAVVYVDSGSTDDSVIQARALGVEVVDLDLSIPFTAARARNEGFARLLFLHPGIEAVQFIDGDCEIVPGYLGQAMDALLAEPNLAVVCGRRRERFPDASLYNRLCDMEWNTPTGIANACGGDALIRTTAFQKVGGYDPAVIAGEEPEMCVRLRAAGWIIRRIDAEMTLHDAAMTRFSQWWTRNVRGGHAYAQGNAMHGGLPEHFRQREVRSIERWAMWPVLICFLGTAVLGLALGPRWAGCGLLVLLMYPLLALKVSRYRMKRGDRPGDALLYGTAVALGKFPQHLGIRRFRSAQRRGVRNVIIEYKQQHA